MAEISDETKVAIPIRNLVVLGVAVATATTAYVTLNARITAVEHGLEMQAAVIKENAAFVHEWPLGLRGALPDDLMQNAKIAALEEKHVEIKELHADFRRLQLDLSEVSARITIQEQKADEFFNR